MARFSRSGCRPKRADHRPGKGASVPGGKRSEGQGRVLRVVCTAAALAWASAAGKAGERPDARAVVSRSVEKDRMNFSRANDYNYVEHREERALDKSGRVQKIEARTWDVLVIDGRLYKRLIAKNGRTLEGEEAKKEQAKLDRELARRTAENEEERRKKASEEEKRRMEGRAFAAEIPDAFVFTLAGEERIGGRAVWIIDAVPKPGYRGKTKRWELLAKLKGRLWIGQEDYQWVRVEAETVAPVRFGWVLAKLDRGARLTFEQRRVNGEVWLPSRAHIEVSGRLALVKKLRARLDVEWRDYRKFRADSRMVEEVPKAPD